MKYRIFILSLVIFITGLSVKSEAIADTAPKTVIVILDQFSLDLVQKIGNHNGNIGLINNRTESTYDYDGKASQVMTIALGRRVKSQDSLFIGIEKLNNDQLVVNGFDDIVSVIMKNSNKNIKKEFLMGEYFRSQGVEIGYIGSDITSLMAADGNGIIHYGVGEVRYEKKWLLQNTQALLSSTEVMILSYEISNVQDREALLLEYLGKLKGVNVLIISFEQLSPVALISNKGNGGTLTSSTTRRTGIISNLDIVPYIAGIYGLRDRYYIGSEISTIHSIDSMAILEDNLVQGSNLNTIKYILHGLVIAAELYIIFGIKIGRINSAFTYEVILNSILLMIFLSFGLGKSKSYKSITMYLLVLIILSIVASVILSNKLKSHRLPLAYFISFSIYACILYGTFLNNDVLYTSFMGYNNILVGGRFYGLNNGIVGVFLASSVLLYYFISRRLRSRIGKDCLFLIIPIINIIALSGRYGANTGGYFTAVILLILIILDSFRHVGINRIKIILVALIICLSLFINLYSDIISSKGSHAGELFLRIKDYGFMELINIIIVKLRQLIFMTLFSPWVIILIGQLYYIKSNYSWIKEVKEAKTIFYIAIIGLLVNDTGVIAFVYMNTFLMASLSSLHNIEKRDLC